MRPSIVASTLALAASTVPAHAQPAGQGAAQYRTSTALQRIARIDPQLRSVLAVDPTAMDQARKSAARSKAGTSRSR